MSTSSAGIGSLLDQSPRGLFYVEDEESGLYEIEAFLGDVTPICQVFRATYSTGKRAAAQSGGGVVHRRGRGNETHQVVALKLVRVDQSAEFMAMRREVENSFKIGPNDDQENNVITANNWVVGIYNSFCFRNFLCVSMPYLEMGSLRYIINARIPDRKLPEKCTAVVLREILTGLSMLHGRGRIHIKLNAGNIFFGDVRCQAPLKLGYRGSTYFHDPEREYHKKIWDEDWSPGLGFVYCNVSRLPWNIFWTVHAIYEPSTHNYTPASDIWNLGVTALELVLGPFSTYRGNLRTRGELRAFLINLRNDQQRGLPKLSELFLSDPAPVTPFAEIERGSSDQSRNHLDSSNNEPPRKISKTAAARKVKKGLLIARKKVKIFVKKIKKNILGRQRTPDPPESGGPNLNLNVPSSSFTAMVKRCLALDPNERPTAAMLLNDPFFEEHQDADVPYLLNFVLRHELVIRPNS